MHAMELIERARAAAGMPQHVGLLEYDSVQAVLAAAAARFPDKPALSSLGHTLTFRELDRLTAAFASWLQHHTDLQPGDRIALIRARSTKRTHGNRVRRAGLPVPGASR